MNKDNAHEFIPLLQALADGEIIQKENEDGWINLTAVAFYDGPKKYRVKPPNTEKLIVCVRADNSYIYAVELTAKVKKVLEAAGIDYE